MRVSVLQESLNKALKALKRVHAPIKNLAQTELLHISTSDTHVHLTLTDLDTIQTVSISAQVGNPGSGWTHFRTMHDIVELLSPERIDIHIEQQDKKEAFRLYCGSSKTRLYTSYSEIVVPDFSTAREIATITLDSERKQAIKNALKFASTDKHNARPALYNARVFTENGKLYTFAANGYQAGIAELPADILENFEAFAVNAGKLAKAIESALAMSTENTLAFSVTSKHMLITADDYTIALPLEESIPPMLDIDLSPMSEQENRVSIWNDKKTIQKFQDVTIWTDKDQHGFTTVIVEDGREDKKTAVQFDTDDTAGMFRSVHMRTDKHWKTALDGKAEKIHIVQMEQYTVISSSPYYRVVFVNKPCPTSTFFLESVGEFMKKAREIIDERGRASVFMSESIIAVKTQSNVAFVLRADDNYVRLNIEYYKKGKRYTIPLAIDKVPVVNTFAAVVEQIERLLTHYPTTSIPVASVQVSVVR